MRPPEVTSNLPRHLRVAVHRLGTAAPVDAALSRVHGHASIGYLTHGRASLWMGCLWKLGPGDLILVPEGAPHYGTGGSEAQGMGLSICSSCLAGTAAEPLLELFHGIRAGASAVRSLQADDRPVFQQLIDAMEREQGLERPWRDLAVAGLLTSLTALILRAGDPGPRQSVTPTLSSQALSFVDRHACEAVSLSDVARHLARSPAHVAAVVKAETGRTVVQWITEARMSQARQRLLCTDEAIDVIADRLGYASPSHFHRVFKRSHGLAPGAWRRAHLEE